MTRYEGLLRQKDRTVDIQQLALLTAEYRLKNYKDLDVLETDLNAALASPAGLTRDVREYNLIVQNLCNTQIWKLLEVDFEQKLKQMREPVYRSVIRCSTNVNYFTEIQGKVAMVKEIHMATTAFENLTGC